NGLNSGPMSTSLSGPVLKDFHASLPVSSSRATTQPRTPSSPPELPTYTCPLATAGAMVIVSPVLMLASRVRQSALPVSASRAITWPSSVVKMYLPWSYEPPLLTTSQQAMPWLAGAGLGENFHFNGAPGLLRSSA